MKVLVKFAKFTPEMMRNRISPAHKKVYSSGMQKYTLGFVFDASLTQVLLMHKTKPASQAGRVNGLGGKVEAGEDSKACIVREIREEADLPTIADQWVFVGTMRGKEWSVDVYAIAYKGDTSDAKAMEEERVEWFPTDALPENAIGNLSWLIPMSKDKLLNGATFTFLIDYT